MSLPPLPATVGWDLAEEELAPHLQPFAERELAAWRARRPAAVEPLTEAVTSRIYRIRPEEVRPFLRPPIHEWPFPEGSGAKGRKLSEVEDLTGGLPLALALQRFVEAHGCIPTWREATEWFSTPEQLDVFVGPAWRQYHEGADTRPVPVSKRRWQLAIGWRIGNAYLSFLREADFLSRMIHDHGIPLRMHILADAVLKTDFWIGRHAVCVFVPNDKRQRKASPEASTGIIHEVEIGDGTRWVEEDGMRRRIAWNEINQAPDRRLAELAAAIREDRPSSGVPAQPAAVPLQGSRPRSSPPAAPRLMTRPGLPKHSPS